MKTSLAIVFATAALMFGAILSLTSVGSAAEYGSYSNKTPGRCESPPAQTNSRCQADGDCDEEPDWPLLV